MRRLFQNRNQWIVRLLILTALLSFMTSCTIEEFSKTTDSNVDGSIVDDSVDSPSNTDIGMSTEDAQILLSNELIEQAEPYMTALVSGDLNSASEQFNLSESVLLPATYECDEEIYRILYTHMTYSYGTVIKKGEQDYDLEVTCTIPDLQSCIRQIYSDEVFMVEVSEAWVIAVCEQDTDHVNEAYVQMVEKVITEALRRIESWEYKETVSYSGSFSMHDNLDSWNVLKYPKFATFLNQDKYMSNLAYLNTTTSIELIRTVGTHLVEEGELKSDVLEQRLEELQMLVDEN